MRDAALNQGLVTRDAINPEILLPTERATTQTQVSKDITVNGDEMGFLQLRWQCLTF